MVTSAIGMPLVGNRLHREQSILSGRKTNRGNDPDLLYAAPDGLLVHKPPALETGSSDAGGFGTRVLRIRISPNPTFRFSLCAAVESSLAADWP